MHADQQRRRLALAAADARRIEVELRAKASIARAELASTVSANWLDLEALSDWLEQPETRFGEFRFPGILKLFFGADPAGFAGTQAAHHGELAERFEAVRERIEARALEITPQRRAVLDTGIALHRWWEARWAELERSGLLK